MAGGNFDRKAGKVRPGTYINIESTRQEPINKSNSGTVIFPLVNHSYGPEKEFIKLSCDAPDAAMEKLGYSIYDDNPGMLLVREAFKRAAEVIVYIPKQGAKASATAGGITGKAKYGGSRGKDLSYSVVANPIAGFDVAVHLKADTVSEYEGLNTIEELIAKDNAWIDFSGTGPLSAVVGTPLTGGADGVATNADFIEYLDSAEGQRWKTMAFPLMPSGEVGDTVPALLETIKSKIQYLREGAGKYRKAVVSGLNADYEGIINVTNSVVLKDGTALTPAQATVWVAGVDARASITKSNTYEKYDGAVDIVGLKSHAEAVSAINAGEFFFSFSEAGDVVVEYDINTLVTFDKPKDRTYRKNRILRVLDNFADDLLLEFPPNKYDNSPTGWDVMEGIGRALLKQYEEAGAIKNVDYENDFLVDRSLSDGDETYFDIGLEPVDSSEKLFNTIKTR